MLLYLSFFWLAGTYLGSQFALPLWPGLALAGLAFSLALLLRREALWMQVLLCSGVFLLGMLRYPAPTAAGPNSLAFYNGSTIIIEGLVEAEPETLDRAASLRLAAHKIKVGDEWKEVSGPALVRLARFPKYRYGDVLRLSGKLETPPTFEGFDYRQYLAHQGIYSVMPYPKVEVLSRDEGWMPLAWLYGLRQRLSAALSRALPEPQASLAQGILLGLRTSIPQELEDAFARTGTTHVIAISGQNFAIWVGALAGASAWLFGRRYALYPVAGGIVIYAMLTGLPPSVLRAAIMGILVALAAHVGRQNSAPISLALAAAVLVGVQPGILWDVSFQLSFAAMAGLVFIAMPLRERLLKRYPGLFEERPLVKAPLDGATTSLGAMLTTVPLIAYYFHNVSLVMPLATLLALPTLPAIMLTSALVAALGLLSNALAQVAGWLAWLPLTYLIEIVRLFSAVPLAAFSISVEPAWVWLYYLGLAGLGTLPRGLPGLVGVARLPRAASGPAVLILIVLAVAVWGLALLTPDRNLRVSFLDVGEGDAILIQIPSGHRILVDGGPSPEALSLELGKRLPLWDHSIDLVVLTHPQEDHLAGLVEVLRRYPVRRVLESGLEANTPTYREWRRLIQQKGIERSVARREQEIALDGGSLRVLYPLATVPPDPPEVNDYSVVLRLAYGNVSFLLTGDIEEQAEQALRGTALLKSDVLKVAHHGSATSSSQAFIDAVSPAAAVISVGKDNPFGHPSPAVLERLGRARLFRTDQHGTIEVTTDGRRLWVRTER